MSHASDRSHKVLSCSSCRQRKIKCDKVQPNCTQCTRFSIDCVYPSRKPTRRAPRPRQHELLDRISRLETIVGKADPEKLRSLNLEKLAGSGGAATTPETVSPERQDATATTTTDAPARYLSGEFWENLCVEVEGIKQALDQPSEESDEEDEEGESPESIEAAKSSISMTPSGFIFGNPNYHEQGPLEHPPREIMIRLWAIYTRNVDPLMKFLHRPTVAKQLETLAAAPPLDAPNNALAHAIYFSAVTCLSPADCVKQLDERRDVLAGRYRLAAERALAEADFLNSNSLETLQALTLYTAMIRCYSHNRNSWALTSLLIRLAQAQNLHRDGDGHRFTPYMAEMRRRLWHFIIVLDIRGSEDRGSDAILSRASYNTAIPTPIDDDAFGPDSTGPLVPKDGPAENVVCMCTAMCSSIFGYMSHPHTNASGEAEHYYYTEDELVAQIKKLEDGFIHTATPTHLPSMYASEIARLVILKLWLNIQYPFTSRPIVTRPSVSRDTMLRTALSVMNLSERMANHEWEDRFKWWTDTYVQWHPLAVALAELCVQPEGELADRAWTVIDRAFPASREKIADTASGPLWRPIKKLLKKAKAAKAEAMMKRLWINDHTIQVTTVDTPPPTEATLPQSEPFHTTALLPPTMPAFTQPYDSMTMDPSYLFQYPPELLDVDLSQALGQNIPMEWSFWNEFLQDTQMDGSPGGSGGGDST